MGREELTDDDNTVYLYEERVLGELVELGAHFSMIRYTYKGNDYEVLVENDDFVLLSELRDADNWGEPE